MKKFKSIIIVNCIMLLIALYTYISLYMPSLLKFSDEEYVAKGGDFLTEELFISLLHYANIFIFYVLNIGFIIRSFLKKRQKGILISTVSILLMISMYIWKSNITKTTIQIKEIYNTN